MTVINNGGPVPDYRGLEWTGGSLPTESEPWPVQKSYSTIYRPGDEAEALPGEIRAYAANKSWLWPGRPYLFFSDMHADTDAFLRSLIASGGIMKNGAGDADMTLTPFGEKACFVIGGDCFDKGPENLRLIRALKLLKNTGAEVVTLAGNHDLRTYIGLACAGASDPRHAHLFIRTGKKAVPFFKEIFDQYIAGANRDWLQISDEDVRSYLLPDEQWCRDFPDAAQGLVSAAGIAKEIRRIEEKSREFVETCTRLGMSLGMVYAAVEKAREMFLEPDGEFFWFFDEMKLALQAGSFLMVHAGVDDHVAALLRFGGVEALNAAYDDANNKDLFELYNGPLGNVFRTKYRGGDFPLSAHGLKNLHASGIYAVIHGHRNLLAGQRITLRSGLLNFECDASVDSGTRRVEGLSGHGGAVTIVHPDARVLGISTDHPLIKDFKPAEVCGLTTII